jgi:hypothetical protein
MTKKGLTAKVYEVKVLPNTARQLVEAMRDQKDLSIEEALEMADYLDERYKMSDFVPVTLKNFGEGMDGSWKLRKVE